MMDESGTDISNVGVADRSAVIVAKIVGGEFSDDTQQVLKSLYKRGMTGWGKKHSAFLDLAAGRTGLTQPQIQVCLLDECCLFPSIVSLALVLFFATFIANIDAHRIFSTKLDVDCLRTCSQLSQEVYQCSFLVPPF